MQLADLVTCIVKMLVVQGLLAYNNISQPQGHPLYFRMDRNVADATLLPPKANGG